MSVVNMLVVSTIASIHIAPKDKYKDIIIIMLLLIFNKMSVHASLCTWSLEATCGQPMNIPWLPFTPKLND